MSAVLLSIAVLVVAACSSGTTPSGAAGTLSVVTTTTVFSDLVQNVGGNRISVHSLVPKGGDVHTFDPSPSDAAALSGARLVVMNGLGLDDWLVSFMQNTGHTDIPIIRLGESLTDVEYIASNEGDANPHLWMDVTYAREYVDRIRLKLVEIDPAGQSVYDANAAAYDAQLASLDDYVKAKLATIPEADRKLVAFHDAFPYYARTYGIDIVGVIVPAPGQDPSAGEIADLINAIESSGVKLILSEVQLPDQLAREIAADTGARIESDLYTDTLTDTVPTYDQMIRWDTDKIVAGLQ